jgi:histone H3/H4
MARTKGVSKKSKATSPKKGDATLKKKKKAPIRGRTLANHSEFTRKRSSKFAIAGAHFRRVARGVVPDRRISVSALDALQRYVENSMTVQLDKALTLMKKVDKKKMRHTLSARYLDIVDECEAPAATGGSIYLA